MFLMVHNSRKKKNTEVSTLFPLSGLIFVTNFLYTLVDILYTYTKLHFNVDLRIFMTLSIPKFIELEFSVLSIS